MNKRAFRAITGVVRQITPPILFNAMKIAVGFRSDPKPYVPEAHRAANYQGLTTPHNARPLHVGRFSEIYERFQPLDPFVALNVRRYRQYNLCYFANMCRDIPGDFAMFGISFGVAPRVVYDFVDFPRLSKTLHLVDPFMGINSFERNEKQDHYNADPQYVLDQYPKDAPIKIYRAAIPAALPLGKADRFSFIHLDTNDPQSEALSLPYLYSALSSGGAMILDSYALFNGQFEVYDPVLRKFGAEPLWLPSGQGVIMKP